jgi:hypothetical protein
MYFFYYPDGTLFWFLLYIHLSITRLVGFCQLTHIKKAFLASFVVVSIIFSYILAFSLIWRLINGVVGTVPPLTRFFPGQSMIDPGSTFLYPTCCPVWNTYLIFRCKTAPNQR